MGSSSYIDERDGAARAFELGIQNAQQGFVALSASTLTVNGNLVNLNAAIATVKGYLFSLNDGSMCLPSLCSGLCWVERTTVSMLCGLPLT